MLIHIPRPLPLLLIFCLILMVLAACAIPQPVESPAPSQPEPTSADQPTEPALEEPAVIDKTTPTTEPAGNPPPAVAAQGPLPPGPVTLVTLGDSLTEGQGDSDSGSGYPGRLIIQLQAARPGSQLVNVGHSGWSSDDLIAGSQDTPSELTSALDAVKKARAAGQAGVALVWIGSNDLWYLYEYGGHPIPADAESQDQAHFRKNIDQILNRLRQAGATVWVALLDDQSLRPVVAAPPDPNQPAFANITRDDLRRMSSQVKAYNAILRDAAARSGAGVVDFSSTDIFTNHATLAEDGNHPNSKGYDLVANNWWQAIQQALKP